MWPFGKKKHLPLSSFSDDNWAILRGESEGAPMFIRRHTGAAPFKGHPELSFRLGIAIPLLRPSPEGLPEPDEIEELDQIEDALRGALTPSRRGVLVLAITTNGMREFVFYIRSEADAAGAVKAAEAAAGDHEVQHYVASDPTWDVYGLYE
ncbi:DUF695 domain-containing protein [Zavarzinella formosa]|uniref:DUF695 domain-containing protein n=1 Tax=Zavarzinella formosa TaxID=360055 RepID=UPI0003121E6E|nr:DUF695 domain-containing protein [Zavarzinella formosa]